MGLQKGVVRDFNYEYRGGDLMREVKTFEDAIDSIDDKLKRLMIDKQRDYGSSNILSFGEFGVLVRLNDKVERLKNLLTKNKAPRNEAIEDTWMDIANYAKIALMLREGIFELPLEEGLKRNNEALSVYLAGPINDILIEQAAIWRYVVEKRLGAAGISVLNPLRGKDLTDPHIRFNLNYEEVVKRDLHDIYSADIILVDLRHEVKLIGTAMEMAYAKQWGKKIYVFGKAYRQHYWIKYHVDRFFDSLNEAIEAIVNEKEGK